MLNEAAAIYRARAHIRGTTTLLSVVRLVGLELQLPGTLVGRFGPRHCHPKYDARYQV